MHVKVRRASNNADLKKFIKLPWSIYRGDPNWVPPLILDMKTKLNRSKYPYFEHSEAEFFIAEREGKVCGRIMATVNSNHNNFHEENIGFFGFFECIDDQECANALFDAAVDYLRGKKVDLMRGPANFSSNDDWGLLINAFDSSPMVMMTYNPPYYIDLIKTYGFKKVMDVYAYWENTHEVNEKIDRIGAKIMKRARINIRTISMKNFWSEVDKIREVYNSAWSKNWGFVPMTKNEFEHIAKDFKMIIDPDFVFIAEENDRPVGFCLALPDINQALKMINGRLMPFGLFKLLYYKKRIKTVRVITMGVIPKYLKRGIDAAFYYKSVETARNKGVAGGEFSWVLETNDMMNRAAVNMGAEAYKTYRLYDFQL